MAEKNERSSKKNIPLLDDSNYAAWSLRMKAYLRRKKLLKYVTEPPNLELHGAALENVKDKLAEAVDILMDFLGDVAFDSVITPSNDEDPHAIWGKITSRYASTSVNNKGRVWLKFMRYEYNGNLKEFISDCTRMLNDVAIVKLGVPDDVLCYSILAKLSEDLHNVVDNIIMNESLVAHPDATLAKLQEIVFLEESRKTKTKSKEPVSQKQTEGESEAATALFKESSNSKGRKKKKNTNRSARCAPGQHNEEATHDADHCWQLHPELRPSPKGASTQLAEGQDNSGSEATALLIESIIKPTVLDSGASHHMVNDRSVFTSQGKSDIKISTGGSKNFLNAEEIGTAKIKNHLGKVLILNDVLFVPGLNRSLISLSRVFKNSIVLKKKDLSKVEIVIDDLFCLKASLNNNLLELVGSSFVEMKSNASCYLYHQSDWHSRLGHPNSQYQNRLVPGSHSGEGCEICSQCKTKAKPFSSHFKEAHKTLEVIHIDLVGPFSTQSHSGNKYFLTIVDQFSGYKAVHFLKSKDQALDNLKQFKKTAETQTENKLKSIISDGGGEFVNKEFDEFCKSEGINHHVTPAYTPENNGLAERTNQTILVKARCLLKQSNLPKIFWAEAVKTATDLSNLMPSKTRKMSIPYETWFHRKVNLHILRPFGCKALILIPKERREFKLDPTSEAAIFIGYENDFSTYKVYKTESKKMIRARNIKFEESVFPGLKNKEIQENQEDEEHTIFSNVSSRMNSENPSSVREENLAPITSEAVSLPTQNPKEINSNISVSNILTVDRRGNPITALLAEYKEIDEPKSFKQAINSPQAEHWKLAIKKELQNMADHNVWSPVEKTTNQKPINCTWVFKIKRNQTHQPIEYKARLCAKGFQQIEGLDFTNTYAPTGRLVSLRILIAYSLQQGLLFHQIDIKSAFLNAPLKEEIYLNAPPGVEIKKNHVLKLNRAMYGLKQAPNAWHETLTSWLTQIGFRRCEAEPCVFWRKGTFLYLHVDDLAIFSKNPQNFKEEVKKRFEIKDLGESNLLLGMNITQESDHVILSQGHYIDKIVKLFDCEHLYPASTPLKPKGYLVKATPSERAEYIRSNQNIRSLIGALLHVSITTRPDITYAVNAISQFLNEPGSKHWDAGIQILRYLKGTRNYGLKIRKISRPQELVGYADADWASCPESRRSVSGNLVLWDGNIISWKSRKQPTLSLSSTEAEYKSIGDITKEIMWIKTLFKNIINLKIEKPTRIFEDNQGAIALAENASNHSSYKTKHMDLRHHFIRREIKIKKIELVNVSTQNMLADFLTKPVGKLPIRRALRALSNLCSTPSSS